MNRITDKERTAKAFELIEKISAENMGNDCVGPLASIYRIAHTARAPKCRKNHPGWTEGLDAAIISSRRRGKG